MSLAELKTYFAVQWKQMKFAWKWSKWRKNPNQQPVTHLQWCLNLEVMFRPSPHHWHCLRKMWTAPPLPPVLIKPAHLQRRNHLRPPHPAMENLHWRHFLSAAHPKVAVASMVFRCPAHPRLRKKLNQSNQAHLSMCHLRPKRLHQLCPWDTPQPHWHPKLKSVQSTLWQILVKLAERFRLTWRRAHWD